MLEEKIALLLVFQIELSVVFYETKVPYIINRQGNGKCPIEAAVNGIADSKEAYSVIIKTLDSLKKG